MKTRTIDPQQKISQVIAVARTLFVTDGYHNVSIPRIVSASGVSIGAIYHHFGNKEGLAKAVHERTLEQFRIQLLESLSGCRSTRDKLSAFAFLVFELTETDPQLMEYMLLMKHGEFMSDVPPICATEPFLSIQDIIATGIEQGELRPADSFLATVAFTGVILRAVELRLSGVMEKRLDDVTGELLDHAWAAIKPKRTS